MEDSRKTVRYSIEWAKSIVKHHGREHARATDIVGRILGITPTDLAYLLATGSSLWQKYKSIVQSWEKWDSLLPKHYTSVKQYWADWVSIWERSLTDTPWSLDTGQVWSIIKERSSRARLPSGVAPIGAKPEGRLPSPELFNLEL